MNHPSYSGTVNHLFIGFSMFEVLDCSERCGLVTHTMSDRITIEDDGVERAITPGEAMIHEDQIVLVSVGNSMFLFAKHSRTSLSYDGTGKS